MLTFSVNVIDTIGTFSSYLTSITNTMLAAGADWAKYIIGSNSIDIEVRIAETATGTANGASATSVFAGQSGGFDVFEFGTVAKLKTGIDPNGVAPDVIISINPDYLSQVLWFDSDPFDGIRNVPSNLTDATTVFLHELGHAWGFSGWTDRNTGALPTGSNAVPDASPYDTFIDQIGGGFFFTGSTAQLMYGGPVPLTTGNLMHYGNVSELPGVNPVAGLMNGVVFFQGTAYTIGLLDLAILQDAGVPINHSILASADSLEIVDTGRLGVLRSKAPFEVLNQDAMQLDSGLPNATFISNLIVAADDTTIPALIVPAFVNGVTSNSTQLDALAAFAQVQWNSYSASGVIDPHLGPYEALGLAFAETPQFIAKFATAQDTAFIGGAYQEAFDRAATAAQVAHFQSQLDSFEALYMSVGIAADVAAISARGAVVGQILGIAASETGNDYAVAAVGFLTDAADGSASYGTSLLDVYGF